MTGEQIILFLILGAALLLFAWGRLRYDLVAILALLSAVIAGLVPADGAFAGFGHPAVVTVAAILILSRALRNSHLTDWAGRGLERLSAHPSLQILGLTTLTAACSAFMNNVGALAIMLPIALSVAEGARRAPSQVLMPISFASLLGGLVTLVGTPPNIVIANARTAATGQSFGMFDFAPVGLGVALAGVLFISFLGWRLLPHREKEGKPEDGLKALLDIKDYIAEARLPPRSPFAGKGIDALESLAPGDVSVVALVRQGERILAPSGFLRLAAEDILVLEADAGALKLVVDKAGLELSGTAELSAEQLRSDRVALIEVVVTPGSRLEGRTARALRLHVRYGVNLLAVARQGESIRERLGQVRFMAGDVLLLQGDREALPEALSALGCLPLAERDLQLGPRRRASLAAPLIFAAAIIAVVSGLVAPQIAFVAAAVGVVLTGDVPFRELYDTVDWPVVVLLGAMIPVGAALETTGGSATVAAPILALAGTAPLWLLLGLLMVITMLLSDIINNAATAVLMAPIGITLAQGVGASVDPFLMAVAVAASSTYLTPIGHQSNLLVMGPGGYRFGDYWRMGLPLDLLILAVGLPLIVLVWPA